MKKLIILLLAALMTVFAAFAEAPVSPFAPYTLTAPAGVTLTENEGSSTFVYGSTRVVAMVISRIPDEDPAAALPLLMQQFDTYAVLGTDMALREGFHGLTAVTTDKFGSGVDQVTAMVLWKGDLLILSGYDMDGDETRVYALMEHLLQSVTVDGVSIIPEQKSEDV